MNNKLVWNAVDLSRLTALSEGIKSKTLKAKQGSGDKWYRIQNQGSRAKVYIYDMIGEWGVTAQDFVNELNGVKAPHIDLHMNTQGGQVFDGIAIYTALLNHPAEVTVYVDALAASAGSFIAQAGSKRVMARNARMMIHDAHGLCIGNADDARDMAKMLDDMSDNIASIYAERAGQDVRHWRKAMRAETWYSAEDAVEAGLADGVAGDEEQQVSNSSNVPQQTQEEALPLSFDISAVVKEAVA